MEYLIKNKDFIKNVLKEEIGIIAICNLLDGVDQGLISKDTFKEFIKWWLLATTYYVKGPTNNEPIVEALAHISVSSKEWDLFSKSLYMGIDSEGIKPDFRTIKSVRTSSSAVLATTTDSFINHLSSKKIIKQIMARADLDTTVEGSKKYNEYVKRKKNVYSDCLRDSASIGSPAGVLWYTSTNKVKSSINKRDADLMRDFLGLIHLKKNHNLFTIEFKKKNTTTDSRPTTLDAGNSRRFKQIEDNTKKTYSDSWGCTADLSMFASGKNNITGGPERVCIPINTNSVTDVKVYPLGRTTLERGLKSGIDDDGAFAKTLLRNRTLKDIKDATINLL